MGRPTPCLATAVAGLALAASGCGGSAADADLAPTRALDRITQICDDLTAAVTGRSFPVEGFEPRDPEAADLPAVGACFETAVQAQRQALASLRALTPPPAI